MTTIDQRRKPWRGRRPRRPLPEVVVSDAEPLAQLTIYPGLMILSRRIGRLWRQHPVSPAAVADVLVNVPVSSGLLPEGVLAYGRAAGEPFYVQYVAARSWALRTPDRTYTIPLPALIWAARGNDYRVWAVAEARADVTPSTRLLRAPLPNTYSHGSICWGSVEERPAVNASALGRVLKLFLEESLFNSHLASDKSRRYPVSVIARWEALARRRAPSYPLRDLLESGTQFGEVLSGAIFGGAR